MPPAVQLQNDYVQTLSLAVQQRRQVLLRYLSWRGDESERNFDPYGILFYDGYWYASGYCHLRHDLRTFRIDRILALEPSDESFERPADFDLLTHVMESAALIPGAYQVEVLLKTSLEHAQQMINPAEGRLEGTAAGIIFRRAADRLEWVANLLMRLDCPVRVIQPVELKEVLRQMATKALQMVGDEAESSRPGA
jgi:predicted DNA-binding transcriptional regulator YafY